MPKIFHVNWFRVDSRGRFLWPGFGENIRVLDWILRRCDGDESIAEETPVGYLPKKGLFLLFSDFTKLSKIKSDMLCVCSLSLMKHVSMDKDPTMA